VVVRQSRRLLIERLDPELLAQYQAGIVEAQRLVEVAGQQILLDGLLRSFQHSIDLPHKSNGRLEPEPAVAVSVRLGLQLYDVLRRRALLALYDVKLHAVTLGQALEALGLDRRMMDEAVLLTVLGRDETTALSVVKPLDSRS